MGLWETQTFLFLICTLKSAVMVYVFSIQAAWFCLILDCIIHCLKPAISLWLLLPSSKLLIFHPVHDVLTYVFFPHSYFRFFSHQEHWCQYKSNLRVIIFAHQRKRLLREKGRCISALRSGRFITASCWHQQRTICSYSRVWGCKNAAWLLPDCQHEDHVLL